MVYRSMYVGYPTEKKLNCIENSDIITASIAYEDECAFLYFESVNPNTVPEDFVTGLLKEFPDGRKWFYLPQIFHYYPSDMEEYRRNVPAKTPIFSVNQLYNNKVASYIYYHYIHQEAAQRGCDIFYSIYVFGNRIISYCEEPKEVVTEEMWHGREHGSCPGPWGELMAQHFQEWPDGHKGWTKLTNVQIIRPND